jgi:hypothetical protein
MGQALSFGNLPVSRTVNSYFVVAVAVLAVDFTDLPEVVDFA